VSKISEWKREYAIGRVFELKRKTYKGAAVCVIVTRDSADTWHRESIAHQIDERGIVELSSPNRARSSLRALRREDFTSRLIARRRPELERFDQRDIDLINYGIGLNFSGRFQVRPYGTRSLPNVPGLVWTVFWARHDSVRSYHRSIGAALSGAWHFTSSKDGPHNPWRDKVSAWATVHQERHRLQEIERALLLKYPVVHRSVINVAARDEGDFYQIRPIGDECPAIDNRWSATISKTDPSVSGWRTW